MADAIDRKLVRAAGISNINADQTRRAHDVLAARGIRLAANQVSFGLLSMARRRPRAFSKPAVTCMPR
jgi:diketogulonate reductase-like aldo/keto reductase